MSSTAYNPSTRGAGMDSGMGKAGAGRTAEHARDAVDHLTQSASSAASAAREAASSITSTVKDTVQDTLSDARERAGDAARRGKELSEDALEYVADHPWTFIGIAVGVGLLAGLALRRK